MTDPYPGVNLTHRPELFLLDYKFSVLCASRSRQPFVSRVLEDTMSFFGFSVLQGTVVMLLMPGVFLWPSSFMQLYFARAVLCERN